jgi:hypothetical protein
MGAFVPYQPYGPDNRPHPAAVDESHTLAAVWPRDLPDPQLLQMPTDCLSTLQAETVATIWQAFSRGRGFLLGDSTGLGKGRMCAATILEAVVRAGPTRTPRGLWISTSMPLYQDAKRDVEAVDPAGVLEWGRNIRFCTYGQLTGSAHDYVAWLNAAGPQAVVVFDEVHAANNLKTKTAKTVRTVQRCLPRAKVLYSTATSASKVEHLCVLERLRLWGPDAGFESFEVFAAHLRRFACSAGELLAIHMKREGLFVSRSLSMRGVDVQMRRCRLTQPQRELYDVCADRWGEAGSAAGGGRQRFFQALITAFKMPTALAEARRGLESGMSVVLAVQGTAEASSQRAKARVMAKTGDVLPSGPPSRMRDLMRAAGVRHADLALPLDPIDAVLETFGADAVAELTGRTTRAVPRLGQWFWSGKPTLNKERAAFQAGERHVAVLSRAGSTGISLHADEAKSRPRLHITVELPWSCETLVQQCGRSHRAGQTSLPQYVVLVTDTPAELRFVSTVAARLEQLGALKHGDRRTAGSQGGEDLLRMHKESGVTLLCLRKATLAWLLVATIQRVGFFGKIVHGKVDYGLLRQDAAKAGGRESAAYTIKMASMLVRQLWREATEHGTTVGQFPAHIHKRLKDVADTVVTAVPAARFAVLRLGLLVVAGKPVPAHWTPGSHQHFPDTFRRAARALMLAAHSSETTQTIGLLTHDVRRDLLERMAREWPAPGPHAQAIAGDLALEAGQMTLDQFLNAALGMPLQQQRKLVDAVASCREASDDAGGDGVLSIERLVLPANNARDAEFTVTVEPAQEDPHKDELHISVRVEPTAVAPGALASWRAAGQLLSTYYMLNAQLAAVVVAPDNPACVDIWHPGRSRRTKRLTLEQSQYEDFSLRNRAAEAGVKVRAFAPDDPRPDAAWEAQGRVCAQRLELEAVRRSRVCTFVHRNPLVTLDATDAVVVRVETPDVRFTGLLLCSRPYYTVTKKPRKRRKCGDDETAAETAAVTAAEDDGGDNSQATGAKSTCWVG